MQLHVPCECGEDVPVTEGEAGSRTTCRCGRTVVVPSLRELRRQAGVPGDGLAPELVIEALLLAKKLPEEDECVLCSEPTNGCIFCQVECERAVVSDGEPPIWAVVASVVLLGWLGALLARNARREPREWGKDRSFTLPLRLCDKCRPTLTNFASVTRALRSVPLYRRLLDKYPRAVITLLGRPTVPPL
jgi:hypothetical protein